MLHHKYYKRTGILEVKGIENVYIPDIVAHYEYILEHCCTQETLAVLIDLRQCNLRARPEELEQVRLILENILLKLKLLKEGLLVDNPRNTVLPIIFQDRFNRYKNYIFKVFSTEDAARCWLNG